MFQSSTRRSLTGPRYAAGDSELRAARRKQADSQPAGHQNDGVSGVVPDVESTRIVLSPDAFERFLEVLQESPVESDRLVALAQRAHRFTRIDLER